MIVYLTDTGSLDLILVSIPRPDTEIILDSSCFIVNFKSYDQVRSGRSAKTKKENPSYKLSFPS